MTTKPPKNQPESIISELREEYTTRKEREPEIETFKASRVQALPNKARLGDFCIWNERIFVCCGRIDGSSMWREVKEI
jgi:hypothetical protein